MGVYYSANSGYGFVIDHEEYMACGPKIVARLKMADKMPEWSEDFEDDSDEFWSAFLHLGTTKLDILTSGSYYSDAEYLQHLVCANATTTGNWGFSSSVAQQPVTDAQIVDLCYIQDNLGFDDGEHKLGYYTGVLQS